MGIGLPDTKLLWGRAGGLCSICKVKVSADKKSSSDAFPFGEQAHIVAEEADGPRGKSVLTLEQRNSYPNLILLCPTCHTKIDKAPEEYPVELLHQFKSQHELWFEKTRVSAADSVSQANELIYADLVDAAAKQCMFETWEAWTSYPLSTHPRWRQEWLDGLDAFNTRITRAVWPGTLPEVERSLQTLSLYIGMAMHVFLQHAEKDEYESGWMTEVRFYKDKEGDYYSDDSLVAEYEKWIDRQMELIRQATKSANWVAETVRRDINPMFFATAGKLAITWGPNMEFRFVTEVLEFTPDERLSEPKSANDMLQQLVNERRAPIRDWLERVENRQRRKKDQEPT